MRTILDRVRAARESLGGWRPRAGGPSAAITLRAGPALIVVLVVMTVLPSHALGASSRTEATVNPAKLTNAQLSSVSCVSATSCIAIGDGNAGVTSSGSVIDPAVLAEGWDGTTWAQQPITNRGGERPNLASVSCVSAAFCVAVGQTGASAFLQPGFLQPGIPTSFGTSLPLIEIWNGATWTAQPTQSGAGTDSGLYGVACLSTRFCVAVGSRNIASRNPPPLSTPAPPAVTVTPPSGPPSGAHTPTPVRRLRALRVGLTLTHTRNRLLVKISCPVAASSACRVTPIVRRSWRSRGRVRVVTAFHRTLIVPRGRVRTVTFTGVIIRRHPRQLSVSERTVTSAGTVKATVPLRR
jgi:hypothetical protein